MSSDEQRLLEAWQKAAGDLGLRLTAPFPHSAPDGRSFIYTALVHEFGAPKGALLTLLAAGRSLADCPHADGYHVSLLSLERYARYDRQLFIDTLDDFGYFGPEEMKPAWYTGKPWTPGNT